MEEKYVRLNIPVQATLHKALKRKAVDEDTTISQLIRDLIQKELAKGDEDEDAEKDER